MFALCCHPSVRLSVRHVGVLVKNGWSLDYAIFIIQKPYSSKFWQQKFHPEIVTDPPERVCRTREGWKKTSHFLALNVNISKMVGDTSKVTISDYYKVAYLLSIGTKIDDLGWPWTVKSSNFPRISQIWAATAAKRMKLEPYCQRCNPLNVLSTLRSLRWFVIDCLR